MQKGRWHTIWPKKIEIKTLKSRFFKNRSIVWSNLHSNSSFVKKSGVRIPVGEGQLWIRLSNRTGFSYPVRKRDRAQNLCTGQAGMRFIIYYSTAYILESGINMSLCLSFFGNFRKIFFLYKWSEHPDLTVLDSKVCNFIKRLAPILCGGFYHKLAWDWGTQLLLCSQSTCHCEHCIKVIKSYGLCIQSMYVKI